MHTTHAHTPTYGCRIDDSDDGSPLTRTGPRAAKHCGVEQILISLHRQLGLHLGLALSQSRIRHTVVVRLDDNHHVGLRMDHQPPRCVRQRGRGLVEYSTQLLGRNDPQCVLRNRNNACVCRCRVSKEEGCGCVSFGARLRSAESDQKLENARQHTAYTCRCRPIP